MADPGAPTMNPIRLGIVDDHPLIAAAIVAATGADGPSSSGPAIVVVGVARDIAAARALLARSGEDAPDVVLCDLQLAATGGVAGGAPGGAAEGLTLLDFPGRDGPKMIVLTSHDRSSFMRAAFERGAAGFLAKSADVADILAAVRVVAAGGTAFSGAALEAARNGPRPPSRREIAILGGIQGGATSEEIGTRLGISPRTVESHLRRLFDRYGVVSRTELAVLALREGWIADAG